MPFVQGRLRQESLSFVIKTECGHCREPIRIEMDSKMQYRLAGPEKKPMVYVPMVDFQQLDEPSIIDGF